MILVRKDKLIAGLWTCMSAKCCSLSRGLALVALSIAFLNQAHAQQDSNTTEPQAVLPQATQLENSPFIHMDVALEMEGIEKSVEGIQDSFASISQSLRVIADSDHLSLEQQQALTTTVNNFNELISVSRHSLEALPIAKNVVAENTQAFLSDLKLSILLVVGAVALALLGVIGCIYWLILRPMKSTVVQATANISEMAKAIQITAQALEKSTVKQQEISAELEELRSSR